MSAILEFAEKLRARADIADVVGKYVDLRRAGTNLKGLCPFHKEKSPSFTVSEEKQIFHCFGCGEGGDVIKFVQRIEKLDWMDALRMLAQELHMELPQSRSGPAPVDRAQRPRIMQLLKNVEDFYATELAAACRLPDSSAARYLEKRQMSPDTISRFRIGLAPSAWDSVLKLTKTKGFAEADALDAGLAIKRSSGDGAYDRFRHRIMFPIQDQLGQTVAFGGRIFAEDASPEEPKYINSPETLIYHKGSVLYGLHLARKSLEESKTALLMEGYLDVIRAHEHGFNNAVATCGTALTEEQAKILKRYCHTVVMVYDGDDAGRKAIVKGCEILVGHDITIRVVLLPDGHDPDSFLARVGKQPFERLLESAQPFFQFLLHESGRMHDRKTAEGKARILESLAPILRRMSKSIQQSHYVEEAAGYLLTRPAVVLKSLNQVRTPRTQAELVQELSPEMGENISKLEAGILKSMVESPSARDSMLAHINPQWLESPLVQKYFQQIAEGTLNLERQWDALLDTAGEQEAAVLRQLALDTVEPKCDEKTVLQVAARLQKKFNQDAHLGMLQKFAPNSTDGDEFLQHLDGEMKENLETTNQAFVSIKRRPKS